MEGFLYTGVNKVAVNFEPDWIDRYALIYWKRHCTASTRAVRACLSPIWA